jgi:hypothetical protein
VFFWESLVGDRRWRLLSAFFLGLSVLAKGPVGLILFVPIAGWTFWREKELRPAFRGWWLLGTLVFVATVATWYVPAYLVNRNDFVQKFLIEQNLNRFTGGDAAHTPPYLAGLPTYFIVLLIGMLPWSLFLWKAWPRRADPIDRYLAVWALTPLVFFTISKAKLPHYVLPCCVPLGMIVASYLGRREPEAAPIERIRYPAMACLVVAVLANAGFIYYYSLFHRDVHELAFYVREHQKAGEDVAAFALAKRGEKSAPLEIQLVGSIKLKMQKTAHPSLVMYLDEPIREPDGMSELLADPNPQWVITRANRIGPPEMSDAEKAMRELRPVDAGVREDYYRLYYLSGVPSSRTQR